MTTVRRVLVAGIVLALFVGVLFISLRWEAVTLVIGGDFWGAYAQTLALVFGEKSDDHNDEK